MSIDFLTAEVFFQASAEAKSADVAAYFADIIRRYDAQRCVRLDIFLDRNTTHKAKMQGLLAELLAKDTVKTTIEVHFHLMPAYSPKLNLVEYLIHHVRQNVLHHADCKQSLADVVERIKALCSQTKIFSKEQIINILGYIESLI
ncbi:MAG: hypothetical protein EAZ92_00225 [Candidatus Kapaibacterium sp.]|nr:MAG: hypothetical protein EAZ92_00225 [Candidatus Kapabacteria bacterium]